MGCNEGRRGILIVDDSESDTDLMKGLFASKDPDSVVQVASSVDEVRKFIHETDGRSTMPNVDIVIVDLNMPKGGGIEVLRTLKSDPDLKRIPVIVFSGSDSKTDIQNAYELGANSYLVKPVLFADLSKMISIIDAFWLKSTCLPKHT